MQIKHVKHLTSNNKIKSQHYNLYHITQHKKSPLCLLKKMRFQMKVKNWKRVTITNVLCKQVPKMRSSVAKSSRSHRSSMHLRKN